MTQQHDVAPADRYICASTGVSHPGPGACPTCGAELIIDPHHKVEIRVTGSDAAEVAAVARQLAEDVAARHEAAASRRQEARLRSPWFSGLFYLTVMVVVVVLLLVAGQILTLWALPIVVVAAALLVSVVGAMQLRQDDRLSERGFLRLMSDVFRRMPLLLARRRAEPKNQEIL